MRYYEITTPLASWSSRVNGQHNPYAQQVEFSLDIFSYSPRAGSSSTVIVRGVPWELIDQAHNFAGMDITISGGMAPGLPLATFQARSPLPGLLMHGKIYRCWGNWIGTDMSLGFTFNPAAITPVGEGGSGGGGGGGGGESSGGASAGASMMQHARFNRIGARSIDAMPFAQANGRVGLAPAGPAGSPNMIGGVQQLLTPLQQIGMATATIGGFNVTNIGGGGAGGYPLIAPLNLIHDMKPGQPLSSAIQQTLSKAFPEAGIDVRIANAALGYQDAGMYQSMEQYNQYIQKLSNSILGTAGYLGVHMSSKDNVIHVWDGTIPVSVTNIDPLDLIGQPTWIEPYKCSIKTILRHDIEVGGYVTLPPTIMSLTEGGATPAGSPQRTNLSFSGTFLVTNVLHIGDFRSPDGANWSTNIEARVSPTGLPTDSDAGEQ